MWNFPKTYGEKFTIEDSIIDQYFNGHYKKFKDKRSRKQFKFDDYFWHYVNGEKEKFIRP